MTNKEKELKIYVKFALGNISEEEILQKFNITDKKEKIVFVERIIKNKKYNNIANMSKNTFYKYLNANLEKWYGVITNNKGSE